MKKKNFVILAILSVLFCKSVFAEQIVLERAVNNNVYSYAHKRTFQDKVVKIYVNEFTSKSDKTEKFGYAYAIESNILKEALSIKKIDGYTEKNGIIYFNDIKEAHLMYYIKGNKFYLGWYWAAGISSEVTKSHVFYEFDLKDGYGLYFMFAYASAINDNLTGSSDITFYERKDINGHSTTIANDNESDLDMSFNTSRFPEYVECTEQYLENGCIHEKKVWIDGKFRDVNNTTYTDVNGRTWKSFQDDIGFHVRFTNNVSSEQWREHVIPTYAFKTVKIRLRKSQEDGKSSTAGKKISENLKKYGLYLTKWMAYNSSTMSGSYKLGGGYIVCYYDKFRYNPSDTVNEGLDLSRIGDTDYGTKLVDYKQITPKKLIIK